jgi:hypothetical protein
MPDVGGQNVTPGTADQTISAGYHNGSGRVAGDPSLVPGNIRSGATLFEVTGTSIEASGDATPDTVLYGRTFSSASGPDTGTMPNVGAQNITPTTSDWPIFQGYHVGTGKVEGDADLISGNIRSGISIFGVSGNPAVVNTGTGDATSDGILSDRRAWVDGSEITGTMPNVGVQNITPGTTAQTITGGYHNGSGEVAGDGDFVPGNIRYGVNLFGVEGVYPTTDECISLAESCIEKCRQIFSDPQVSGVCVVGCLLYRSVLCRDT